MSKYYSSFFDSDPSWDAFASQEGFTPVEETPPDGPIEPVELNFKSARQYQEDLDKEWESTHPIELVNYECRHIEIPVRDGAKVGIKVSCPNAARLNSKRIHLPVLFVTHGGGYISGSHASEEAWLIRSLQERFEIITISVEYRLAPEHKYPTWINDAWDVLAQLLKDSNSYLSGLPAICDLSKLILIGSSAGAGISAVLSQVCRDEGVPVFGVVLNVPMLCEYRHFPSESGISRSYLECNQGILGSAQLATCWNSIFASSSDRSGEDPRVSPLLGNLDGLPPHLIFVAGRDPLRDEGIEYANRLVKSSVPATLHVYKGVPHHFAHYDEVQSTQRFLRDLTLGLEMWLT